MMWVQHLLLRQSDKQSRDSVTGEQEKSLAEQVNIHLVTESWKAFSHTARDMSVCPICILLDGIMMLGQWMLSSNSQKVSLALGVGKKKSIHQCIAIYFFPIQYRFIKSSESIRASDHLRSLAGPLGPRLQQLEASCPRPRSRVGGWCAAESPSELRRQIADVWRTALSETVNSHPGHCPRVARE